MLRAGIDRFVAEIEHGRDILRASSRDAGTTLEAVARELLRLLGEERDVLRIVWRELDQFPDLQERVGRDRIQSGYQAAARWVGEQVAAGRLTADDPDATAVVLMSSVTMYRVLEALFGEPPGRISDERFLRAWLAIAAHGVLPREGGPVPSQPCAEPADKTPRRARNKQGAGKKSPARAKPRLPVAERDRTRS